MNIQDRPPYRIATTGQKVRAVCVTSVLTEQFPGQALLTTQDEAGRWHIQRIGSEPLDTLTWAKMQAAADAILIFLQSLWGKEDAN
jgi:hypothetical protein